MVEIMFGTKRFYAPEQQRESAHFGCFVATEGCHWCKYCRRPLRGDFASIFGFLEDLVSAVEPKAPSRGARLGASCRANEAPERAAPVPCEKLMGKERDKLMGKERGFSNWPNRIEPCEKLRKKNRKFFGNESATNLKIIQHEVGTSRR
jgi:hypothetical protein